MNRNRERAVSPSSGITLVRGGQTVDEGFFESVLKVYTNLSNSSAVLVVFVVLVFAFVAEEAETDGPFEQILSLINNAFATSTSDTDKKILSLLQTVFKFFVTWKIRILLQGFIWLPSFARPSTNNYIISAVVSLLSFVLRGWSTWDFLILSQFHLVFSSVRKPSHKLFVFAIALLLFFVGVNFGDSPTVARGFTSPISKTSPPPPPPPPGVRTRRSTTSSVPTPTTPTPTPRPTLPPIVAKLKT